jgi:hypothetical protein
VVLAATMLAGCRRPEPQDDDTATSSAGARRAEPTATAQPTGAPKGVGDPALIAEILEYHNTKSEQAGKMTMTAVVQLRIDDITDKARVAHAEYSAEPAKKGRIRTNADYRWADRLSPARPPAAMAEPAAAHLGGAERERPLLVGASVDGETQFGPYRWATIKDGDGKPTDARTFEYRRLDGRWAIKSMGGPASASFGADLEGWSDGRAIEALTEFYNKRGMWAGLFRLGAVERYRVDRIDSDTKLGFIEYLYIPLPGNRRETGYDKRTFNFEKRLGSWVVTRMDGNMSAFKGLSR